MGSSEAPHPASDDDPSRVTVFIMDEAPGRPPDGDRPYASVSLTTDRLLQVCFVLAGLLQRLVDAEARGLLPWRELRKGLQELADDGLRRHQQERAIGLPLAVEQSCILGGAFERIAAQVVHVRHSHRHQWLLPHSEAMGTLF